MRDNGVGDLAPRFCQRLASIRRRPLTLETSGCGGASDDTASGGRNGGDGNGGNGNGELKASLSKRLASIRRRPSRYRRAAAEESERRWRNDYGAMPAAIQSWLTMVPTSFRGEREVQRTGGGVESGARTAEEKGDTMKEVVEGETEGRTVTSPVSRDMASSKPQAWNGRKQYSKWDLLCCIRFRSHPIDTSQNPQYRQGQRQSPIASTGIPNTNLFHPPKKMERAHIAFKFIRRGRVTEGWGDGGNQPASV